ncbi:MAG: tetratricopeptide repeat protein [Chitinophagales bacterium]
MTGDSMDNNFEELNELVKRFESARKNDEYIYLEESDLEEIVDFYLDGQNFEKAIDAADKGIEQYQFSSTFYIKKAEVLIEMQQYDLANELLDKVNGLSPNDIPTTLLRIDILIHHAQYKEAVALLEHIIEKAHTDERADLYLELADVYEEWEKYDEVFEILEQCLEIDANNEEALNRLWFCTELTEKYDASIEIHQALIDREPYNLLAWYNLAHAYSGMHLYEKSVEAFEYAIVIDDEYELCYKDCGSVLYKMGQYNKAIELYTEAIEKGSPQKEVYYNIGRCYDKLDKRDKAREFYKKSISIDPYYAKAFHKIGENFLETELPKSALSPLERAVKLDKKNDHFLHSLAKAYIHVNEYDKAEQIYVEMIQMNNLNKQAHLDLAALLYEKGALNEAVEEVDIIIDLFDDDKSLLYIKVIFLLEIGNRAEGLSILTEALACAPDGLPYLYKMLPEIQNDAEIMLLIEQMK